MSIGIKPGRVTATLPNGTIACLDNVLDCMLTFHLHVRLGGWIPIIGNACDLEGRPWRPPYGMPLDARMNNGDLVVKKDFAMWVMAIATGSRRVQVRTIHKVIGIPEVVREFAGPLLKKSYLLVNPIHVLADTPFLIAAGAAERRTGRLQGERVQIDLACLFVRTAP